MVAPDILFEDTSEMEETAIIQHQLDETVQVFPDAKNNKGGALGWGVRDLFMRNALLQPRGSWERLRLERAWYYHEDNSMFRALVAGLTKRLQSLPYEIKAPDEYGDTWDKFVRYANFSTWESFLSELIVAYSVFDIGAFIEIIAPGNPMKAPTGAATGMAILDTRRCYVTGDPMYPVVYIAGDGTQHLLHRTRVIQFVDMEERNEDLPDWGDSALARCITAIFREILMAQYMRASLDDMPAPGFAIAKNLTDQQVMQQIARMKEKRGNDQDMLGRLVFLFGADTSQAPALEFVQFQKEFSGFDPDKLANMNAKYMAAGAGVDIQDFWELSGQGIGTATQSQVLAEKSKGRALGRLIKGIERMINDVVPEDVEFAFKYRNEEEDLERAQTAQAWATTIEILESVLSPDEKRIVAANNIDAVKDAITDEGGNIIRWDDVDPRSEEQADTVEQIVAGTPAVTPGDDDTPDENFDAPVEKDYRRTAKRFRETFNKVVSLWEMGITTPGSIKILIMDELRKGGRFAYLDGLKRAGKRRPEFDDQGQAALALWLSKQRGFVNSFVSNVVQGKFTAKQLANKGVEWTNGSLSDMLYKGMEDGAPKKLWRWQYDHRKDHCVTCLRLNGQVHQMKTYASRGLLPRSTRLVCTGRNCGCDLVPDDGPARGRLAAVRFVRRSYSSVVAWLN